MVLIEDEEIAHVCQLQKFLLFLIFT